MKGILFVVGLLFFRLLAPAQNIGIGTTNPTKAKLEVHGAVDATSAIFGGEIRGISIQRAWPGIGYNSYYNNGHRYLANGRGMLQFLDPDNGYMAWDFFNNGVKDNLVSGNRFMVFSKEGGVHIGSSSLPSATLSIARGGAPEGTAVLYSTLHRSLFNSGIEENTHIRSGLNNGTVFINDIPGGKISLNGFVGINTATPEYPLEIRQPTTGIITAFTLVEPTNFNYWQYFVPAHGTLDFYLNGGYRGHYNNVNGSYSSASDRRLKTNITTLANLLPKLTQLQPVQYEMKHDNPQHVKSIGFIAQDLKGLFPQLVSVSNDTTGNGNKMQDLHGISYSGFGVLAIKGVQEQQEAIQSQRDRITALQERLVQLERLLKEKR